MVVSDYMIRFTQRVAEMGNCRLKRERQKLNERLIALDEEIERRMGKGGGGLK